MKINEFLSTFNKDQRGFYKMDKVYTYSIDSNKTKLRDDAFSVVKTETGNMLLIHIAYTINEDNHHKLNEVKFKNLIKYYSYSNLSNFSLDQSKQKDSLTLVLNINKNGIIDEFEFVKSIINVDINHTFKDVKHIFSNGYHQKRSQAEVQDLKRLYLKMRPFLKRNIMPEHIVTDLMQVYDYALGTAFKKEELEPVLDELNLKKKVDRQKRDLSNVYVRGTSPIYDPESYFIQMMATDFILNKDLFEKEALKEFYVQNKDFLKNYFAINTKDIKRCYFTKPVIIKN